MSDTIEFYTNPMSRGRVVHWMLEEVGAAYTAKMLDFKKKDQKTPEYLKINPMGKIPAIVHRGVVVTETAAICAYLADAFPKARMAPANEDPLRGAYFRWLFFGGNCVENAMLEKKYPRVSNDGYGAIGYGSYQEIFDILEKILTPGPFLLGNQFSAADVFMASLLGWGMMIQTVEPRPVFQKYLGACSDRPAYARADQKGKDLIAELG